jgi:hypothetical protein
MSPIYTYIRAALLVLAPAIDAAGPEAGDCVVREARSRAEHVPAGLSRPALKRFANRIVLDAVEVCIMP